ncbi:MAG: HD domain-containing protein [Deltaproteobacteria bacterium]|nr:HD domain-containing protein [Deltaproteobacteria bacterium]
MGLQKNLFVRSLKKESQEGRKFRDFFLVLRKNPTTTAEGQPYLRLTLADSTDSIEAFVWDRAAETDRLFREGDIVEVEGSFKTFRGTPQVVVRSVGEVISDRSEVDIGAFQPASKWPRKEMLAELKGRLSTTGNPWLAKLYDAFLDDPAISEALLTAPAAKSFHHAFVGGLLEHTLGLVRLAGAIAPLYADRLNPDMVVAGAFLHDIGKLQELSQTAGIDYTDEGRLLGHITIGTRMVHERAATIDGFPPLLLVHLEHLVLSHHEKSEWGSPVSPQTLEALLLHYIDNLDAKLCGAADWIEKERLPGSDWTSFWKGLGYPLYANPLSGPRFEGAAAAEEEDDLAAHFLREEAEAERAERSSDEERERRRNRRDVPGQGKLGF